MTNNFKTFWKISNDDKALTKSELVDIQNRISYLQKRGFPSSKIITSLQNYNKKIAERWKAERAFWTEVKQKDTKMVGEIGQELDITKYKVILSPNACPICINKTDNGEKVFNNKDIEKTGWGKFVPWHPNCYCIVYPVA